MARVPDTLRARKAGAAAAAAVARRARAVVRAGGLGTIRGRAAARRLDQDLRRDGNRLNPGTSADLVAAALFVWLLETPVRHQLAAEPADPRDCGPDPGGASGAGYGAPKGAKPRTQAWRAR
jgi:hypothetical protein